MRFAYILLPGFERVAEEFMGRRKWRLYQEKVLKSWCPSIEREIEVKDWDPTDDKCSFCDLEPSGKLTDDEPGSPFRSECFNSTVHNNNNNNNTNKNTNNNNHIDLLEVDESDTNSLSSTEDAITTMNALDSVTSMAAIAALTGPGGAPNPLLYPPGVFPRWYLPQPSRALLEGMTKTEPPMVVSLPASAGSEMPLDLSAKSSKPPQSTDGLENNIRVPNLTDNKPVMKGRPRMSPMSGRRTYTEDELQAALRDIQSGKLGTRRAAVIYGIPRSTLRNKVYKLALERERDAHLLLAPIPRPSPPEGAASSPTLPVHPEREDSSADDEKEPEMAKPQLTMEDLMRLSALDGATQIEGLTALLHNISRLHAEGINASDLAATGNSVLASYLGQLLKLKENLSPNSEKERHSRKEDAILSSKDGGEEDEDECKGTRDTVGHDDKLKYSPQVLPQLMRRVMAEEKILMDEQLKRKIASENGADEDPSNVILRIPSFKPNAGCSKPNNGESEPRFSASPAGASQENSRQSVISPSLNGDSDSPPIGKTVGISSLRDAIAKSISQKFQQDGVSPHGLGSPVLGPDPTDTLAKRGSYSHVTLSQSHSVLKNHFDRGQQRPSSAQANAQGKGTRPKRGKYRNYDRDSLVEAVRAVQRGEMSVHRAGSYYGVPHSTLEYKVKERHLMRPRKREPKGEDKNKLTSSSVASAGSNPVCLDKPKPLALAPKLANSKPAFPNPATLPNGLKIPPSIFETGVSPLAAYAGSPFPFWPPTPFHALPLDITRAGFPTTPEQLFAPQLMRGAGNGGAGGGGGVDPPPSPSTLPASTRRIAESLYDGTGNSGSFLDGIIRSSLEMGLTASQKPDKDAEKSGKNMENMTNKALLDQLCRNSRLTPVLRESNSDDDGGQRNVAFDLSRSSDDDYDDRRPRKGYGGRQGGFGHRRDSKRRKSVDNDGVLDDCSRVNDDKGGETRGFHETRSYRSSISDDRSKHSSSDVEMNGDREELSPGDVQEDDDMDNISNHASDEDDVKDS
ncbi:hypothetical protein RUM43_012832 [Polyplax serrata]|uniref:HTH psq-type domain-containing protein n=1 Tax=Polyplax serrata TaxID=468196 RepID=A0AAN8S6J1_POLSC